MHHFFAYLYRLRYIERWSLMRNNIRENVAEHSYYVAVIAHALATIARDVFDEATVDPATVATYALFHDVTEVFTGDIPTPVKHHNAQLLGNFRVIEHMATERFIGLIPSALQPAYAPLMRSSDISENVSRFVKAADLLDAYFKCISERNTGNREFSLAETEIHDRLTALHMPSVDYFLSELAPSIHLSLDALQKE